MKKSFLILALILAAVLLAGCGGSDDTYPAAAASQQQKDPMTVETPTDAPSKADTSLPEGYDPASEEDKGGYVSGAWTCPRRTRWCCRIPTCTTTSTPP